MPLSTTATSSPRSNLDHHAEIAQRSGAATKTIVVRNGFAACCEEWLCLSVKLALSHGLRPWSRKLYGIFLSGYASPLLKSKLNQPLKQGRSPGERRAQRKGTAIPHNRRRSRAERKILLRKQEVARLLHRFWKQGQEQ